MPSGFLRGRVVESRELADGGICLMKRRSVTFLRNPWTPAEALPLVPGPGVRGRAPSALLSAQHHQEKSTVVIPLTKEGTEPKSR